MDITNFFNCYNVAHLAAYRELAANGAWPDDFIPEGTTFRPMWQVNLAYKMADAWLEQSLAGKAINIIFDGPPADQSGRFVEVENDEGQGIRVGEWIDKKDGYWALRIETFSIKYQTGSS